MLIKLVVVLSLTLGAYASTFDWNSYKINFNKTYSLPAEENLRKEIFFHNVERIHKFRQMNPDATFEIGLNHLADRTYEELHSHPKIIIKRSQRLSKRSVSLESLPDSLDWRAKGVVTPVYNQGQIGQVGAFASVEVIETLHAIDTKQLVRGSPAFVSDCCPQPVDPFTCVAKLGGICSETDYPQPTGKCASSKCTPFANFTQIIRLKNHDENMMVSWIQNSSLYVGIDASQISFQMYQSGIYMDNSCDPTQIDHLLQLVGYGKTSAGTIYWICRNSWGTSWGEQGYIRILRGKNVCGIANYVTQIA